MPCDSRLLSDFVFDISYNIDIPRAFLQEDFIIRTSPLKSFKFSFGFLYFYAFRSVEYMSEMLILLKPCLSVVVVGKIDIFK